MLTLYRRFLTLLHITDTQSRIARLLCLILFVAVFFNILHILLIGLLAPHLAHNLWFNGLSLLVHVTALVLLRRGYFRPAGWLACIYGWLAVMYIGYQDGGIFASRFLLYIPLLVLTPGLLLGWRAALVFTLLTLIGPLFLASGMGLSGEPVVMPASYQLNIAIAIVITGILVTIMILSTNYALTQAQQSAKRLRESEEKYRTLFDASLDAIFLETTPAGRILDCNEVACQLYGYTKQELQGLTARDLVPEHVLDTLPKSITEGKEGGSWTVEAESKRKDGSVFPTEVSIRVITRSEEKQVIVYVRDISDRQRSKAIELERERLRLELENERNLLNFKAQFLSQVSHEFRTPLSVIMSSKELLENYYDRLSPERRQEHFVNITKQTQSMVDMLDDLLTINRDATVRVAFSPAPVDLQALCRELIEQIELIDRSTHQFVFNATGIFTEIVLDAKCLKHSLLNLLTNATKYSPEGSVVELRLAWADEDVVIQVIDQGIGIPLENQAQIFEPFFRAANVKTIQGTGLGLMIARNNIIAHGGTLTFESEEGVGTTFEIRLPASSSLL